MVFAAERRASDVATRTSGPVPKDGALDSRATPHHAWDACNVFALANNNAGGWKCWRCWRCWFDVNAGGIPLGDP